MTIETNEKGHNLAPVAPINPVRDAAHRLLCIACNGWTPAANAWADFNGPAFRAFYCTPCAIEKREG